MEKFCKGLILGLVVGLGTGAISVARNKKLYGIVKEKTDIVNKKLSNLAGKVKQKLDSCSEKGCNCEEKQVDKNNQNSEIVQN